jgi:hypothetical protein
VILQEYLNEKLVQVESILLSFTDLLEPVFNLALVVQEVNSCVWSYFILCFSECVQDYVCHVVDSVFRDW